MGLRGTPDTVKGKEKDERSITKEGDSFISGPASRFPACYFCLTLLAKFLVTHVREEVDLECKLFCFLLLMEI